jgi:hypothetical protein
MAKSKGKMPKYPKKPEPGRPIKLTPEVQDRIIKALKVGNYFETSCAMAGIHKDTAYEWLKKGAGGDDPENEIYRQFSDAVEIAQAESEARDLEAIDACAQGVPAEYGLVNGEEVVVRKELPRQWQAAAWRLERKFPKRWGKIERLEHTGKDGAPLTFVDLIMQLGEGITDEREEEKE